MQNPSNSSSTPSFKSFKDTSAEELVLYFGYGSNMNETTHKWRAFKCESKFPCVLYDHKLVFDVLGFAFLEGGFANLRSTPGECVHGLGMIMTKKQFLNNIKYKEGPHYEIEDIKVESYRERKMMNAITLKVPNTNGDYKYPSRRYLDLLIQGAEEHKLESEYVEYLKKFPDVKNSLTFVGILLRIFFLFFTIMPFIGFAIFRKCGLTTNKFVEAVIWPFRIIPYLLFNYLPRSLIIKNSVEDPIENRFKFKEK
jgi:hypothetical protein